MSSPGSAAMQGVQLSQHSAQAAHAPGTRALCGAWRGGPRLAGAAAGAAAVRRGVCWAEPLHRRKLQVHLAQAGGLAAAAH